MAMIKKKFCDECKATCQMNVLNVVLFGGGMNMEQSLIQLGLINPKYARLADKEGLDMVAFNIRKMLNT